MEKKCQGKRPDLCVRVQVKPRSLAEKFGLRPGDAVVRISHVPATYFSHDHAKAEILRAGNDLHLVVRRGAVRVPAEELQPTDRSEVVEEQTQYRGNRNPSTQSRSFRIISDSLVEEMNSFPGTHGDSSTANATPFE